MNKQEKSYRNRRGDRITRDQNERITAYRYSDHDEFYSFEYQKDGSVASIDRSDGWHWRRVDSGWVVKNYWDSWSVREEDSGSVMVDDSGIHTTGAGGDRLALPE